MSPALQAAGIRDADHPAGQKAGTARPAQPARPAQDIVFVDVPTEGETVAAGEVFGTIEAVKTVSDAFLPVSGEIVEFNAAVDADPSIVNKDPYGEGWLVKVRVSDPAEYDTLLTAEQYTELIG